VPREQRHPGRNDKHTGARGHEHHQTRDEEHASKRNLQHDTDTVQNASPE
jgi:hypothetical protein